MNILWFLASLGTFLCFVWRTKSEFSSYLGLALGCTIGIAYILRLFMPDDSQWIHSVTFRYILLLILLWTILSDDQSGTVVNAFIEKLTDKNLSDSFLTSSSPTTTASDTTTTEPVPTSTSNTTSTLTLWETATNSVCQTTTMTVAACGVAHCDSTFTTHTIPPSASLPTSPWLATQQLLFDPASHQQEPMPPSPTTPPTSSLTESSTTAS